MEDITPRLIDAVTEDFHRAYNSSQTIQDLLDRVKKGTAAYAQAQEYALEVSRLIGQAYQKHISSASLPDGRMYYNIASRLIPSALDENYDLVSRYSMDVQQNLNEMAGTRLKAQAPIKDEERVARIVDMASNAEAYDAVADELLRAVENYSQSIVDETVRANAEFQHKTGLSPMIIRKAAHKCCGWCSSLAGRFRYPEEIPEDVFRRHKNCRCVVDYDPDGTGKNVQNVHTKQWQSAEERAKIEARKAIDPNREKKMVNRRFNSIGDPMAEVTGAAEKSNPDEIAAFLEEAANSGVEIIRRDRESLGYCPGLFPGQPGQLHMSAGASYSAWCHEMQHFRDDRDAGWLGMRIIADKDLRVDWERRAYDAEIELARQAGREDIVERLQSNFEEERRKIYGNG